MTCRADVNGKTQKLLAGLYVAAKGELRLLSSLQGEKSPCAWQRLNCNLTAEQFQEAVELFKRTEVSDAQLLTAYAVLSATLQVHSWSSRYAGHRQHACY